MLIVNADHLCLAGVASLEELCTYCSRPLAAYPLIMGDDDLNLFHVGHHRGMTTDAAPGLSRANRNALRHTGKRPSRLAYSGTTEHKADS